MINIYKPKLTSLQEGILRLLFARAGDSFNAHRISVMLEVSQPAISKALPLLEKLEYIMVGKDRESGRLSITLNRENPVVMGLKRAENMRMIYESGLSGFLYDSFPGATVILFGSYSLGEDTTKSDIDIAVIGSVEKEVDLSGFCKLLGREITLQFYPSLKGIHKNLKNNILNGIVLKGVVDV